MSAKLRTRSQVRAAATSASAAWIGAVTEASPPPPPVKRGEIGTR